METRASKPWKYVIGIVGGLGPYAHIELEHLILKAAKQRLARPARDQDYPEWLLSSMPSTPDRTEAVISSSDSPTPWLERSLRRLQGCGTNGEGADFAVIACNTAHRFLSEIGPPYPLPLLDMVEETLGVATGMLTAGSGTIGLLATTGTLLSKVYEDRARGRYPGLKICSLLDLVDGESLQEHLVMEPIYGALIDGIRIGGGLKSGEGREMARERFAQGVRRLAAEGVKAVVLGCTEIPLALGRESFEGTTLIDPMQVAAEACIAVAAGERPLPSNGELVGI